MHFTTTLVFDSGFYSDAVSFPVLMEIFAKHKTSSVFLKVEFGLKKLITSVVMKIQKSWDLMKKNYDCQFSKLKWILLSFSYKIAIQILLNKGFHTVKSH